MKNATLRRIGGGLAATLILLACAALPAIAVTVYKTVDENGNLVFSDRPPEDGRPVEVLELGKLNTTPPPDSKQSAPRREPQKPEAPAYSVSISEPADQTRIPMGPGDFRVSASVQPALKRAHMLQLRLDGAPRQQPQNGTTWQLSNVFRGAHQLSVAILDENGRQVAVSDPVTVYVFRPSTAFDND